jgi:hypothetical protein
MSLDGDLADNVVPARAYAPVLKDPFGWNAISKKERVAGVNRFFAHASECMYFRTAPRALQAVTDPVNSVYTAAALFRLFVHILLLYLLSAFLTLGYNPFRLNFILAFALMSPLLQVNYYAIYMGVIDHAVTYTFFYAFPLALALLFFLPLYLKRDLGLPAIIFLLLLSVILAFNGPLLPPVVLVISAIVIVPHFYKRYIKKEAIQNGLKNTHVLLLIAASCLALYSLYLGTYNSDSYAHTASLFERYSKLPEGIFNILTQKLGYPLMLLLIIINVLILRTKKTEESRKTLKILRYIGVFALIYVLLLPLGGYREYRPNILRYDTIMPVTIALMFFYARSTFFILQDLHAFRLRAYIGLIVGFSAVFTIADIDVEQDNICERAQIAKIASDPHNTVRLDTSCTVMSWGIMRDVKYSDVNGEMLHLWNITDRRKLYYQQ